MKEDNITKINYENKFKNEDLVNKRSRCHNEDDCNDIIKNSIHGLYFNHYLTILNTIPNHFSKNFFNNGKFIYYLLFTNNINLWIAVIDEKIDIYNRNFNYLWFKSPIIVMDRHDRYSNTQRVNNNNLNNKGENLFMNEKCNNNSRDDIWLNTMVKNDWKERLWNNTLFNNSGNERWFNDKLVEDSTYNSDEYHRLQESLDCFNNRIKNLINDIPHKVMKSKISTSKTEFLTSLVKEELKIEVVYYEREDNNDDITDIETVSRVDVTYMSEVISSLNDFYVIKWKNTINNTSLGMLHLIIETVLLKDV